jgi:hypothetical protein
VYFRSGCWFCAREGLREWECGLHDLANNVIFILSFIHHFWFRKVKPKIRKLTGENQVTLEMLRGKIKAETNIGILPAIFNSRDSQRLPDIAAFVYLNLDTVILTLIN